MDMSQGGARDLDNTDLTGADLSDTDLGGPTSARVRSETFLDYPVCYRGWLIFNGYLVGPDANLSGANFRGADLTGLDLTGANLTGAAPGPTSATPASLTSN